MQGEGECLVVPLSTLASWQLDLILGIQWLEKLGTMITNWKIQTTQYKAGEETITLTGDPSLSRVEVSLKSLIRTLKKNGGGFIVECNHMGGMVEDQCGSVDIPSCLQPILNSYKHVFHLRHGLPPCRGHEHAINLKHGVDSVSVHP